ncbi:MAG TPA: aldo/keto reductase, partial [Pyrinomonadaceae bacterium]|nr:aldo/keto reductase [Pyrinomonadaceae bacterium]
MISKNESTLKRLDEWGSKSLQFTQMTKQLNNASKVRTTILPSGRFMPVLGQGTWRMGEDPSQRREEIAALRLGLDLGMNLIDTAEMYGEGGAEEVVGDAILGRRSEVFIVSKVYPHNATRRGAIEACERSLRRLKTDYIDVYLLHWRGDVPLAETLDAFHQLKEAGRIRDYGVSNFDVADMEEAMALPGGNEIATNQVLYNLMHRGIEWDLLQWSQDRGIPTMAYSPVGNNRAEQKQMFGNAVVKTIAARHEATTAQVALAWLLREPEVVSIPKALRPDHLRENRAALEIQLTDEDIQELDQAFPPPNR